MINVHDLHISRTRCETFDLEDAESDRFAMEVRRGLLSNPKRIASQWLYDRRGSELFERITELAEYYPTRREAEILRTHAREIADLLHGRILSLVDLGAGDGRKTETLLAALLEGERCCTYIPVDISGSALEDLCARIRATFSAADRRLYGATGGMICRPMLGENIEVLRSLPRRAPGERRCVVFLGSTVGNRPRSELLRELVELRKTLEPGDRCLIGFDLVKDPSRLKLAYDDRLGVTREFNLNLLDRMNRELGARFDRANFHHEALWNPAIDGMESWLIAKRAHTVEIPACGGRFHFREWEGIRTEVSLKFREAELPDLAAAAGFSTLAHFADSDGDFVDAVWQVRALTQG